MARPRAARPVLTDSKLYPPMKTDSVDPSLWRSHPKNPRSDKELQAESLASKIIAEGWSPKMLAGVPIRPLLVANPDGTYTVLRGNRRKAALDIIREKNPEKYKEIVGKGIEVDYYTKPLSDILALAAMNDNVDVGLVPWSQPARFVYFRDLVKAGMTRSAAAKELGMAVNPKTGQAKNVTFEALLALPDEVQDYWISSQRGQEGYHTLRNDTLQALAKHVREYRDGPGKGTGESGPEFEALWDKFKSGEIANDAPAVMQKKAAEDAAEAFARAGQHDYAKLAWLMRGHTYNETRRPAAQPEPSVENLIAELNEFVDYICGTGPGGEDIEDQDIPVEEEAIAQGT